MKRELTEEEKKELEDMKREERERKPIPGHKIHVPDKFSMDITEPLPRKPKRNPGDGAKK